MQQIIRKANYGALRNPLFRCVIVSVPAPLKRANCARTKTFRGLNHAEDSNCTGCILGDAGRCRRCRYTRKTAAASAASGRQGSDRQGSAWQISNSTARRDQGLTICVFDARKIERSAYASHFHTYAPLRRGICFSLESRCGGGAVDLALLADVPERARPDTGTNSTSGNVTTFRDRSGRITGVTPGALWSQQVFPDPRWTGSKIL